MSNMVYKDSSTRKRMQDAYLLLLSRNYFFETTGVNFTGFTHLNSHEKWLPST